MIIDCSTATTLDELIEKMESLRSACKGVVYVHGGNSLASVLRIDLHVAPLTQAFDVVFK